MSAAPDYPGYKQPCNGCGQCCQDMPCSIARQFFLWNKGKCSALKFRAGRYWCDVVTNPQNVSVALKKIPKSERIDAIGTGQYCDARK